MSNSAVIRYAGTFRFADRATLETSLAQARARIDIEQELAALEGGWLRCFVMLDITLTVNIALPALPEHRAAAAEIFAVLAREAIDGKVSATIDSVPVEQFVVARLERVSGPVACAASRSSSPGSRGPASAS